MNAEIAVRSKEYDALSKHPDDSKFKAVSLILETLKHLRDAATNSVVPEVLEIHPKAVLVDSPAVISVYGQGLRRIREVWVTFEDERSSNIALEWQCVSDDEINLRLAFSSTCVTGEYAIEVMSDDGPISKAEPLTFNLVECG